MIDDDGVAEQDSDYGGEHFHWDTEQGRSPGTEGVFQQLALADFGVGQAARV